MKQFELEIRDDKSVQLRLISLGIFVDLVFVDQEQFLHFVAGQHKEAAKVLLRLWNET